MLNNNYVCALDIGSSKISGALVLLKNRRLGGIFFDTVPSRSLKGGCVVDSVELTSSVDRILKHLKEKSGVNIKTVYTNISGKNIITRHAQAIIPLAERGNKVISRMDLCRVNEQARILGSSLEEEIIHEIPSSYAIDSQGNILNPVGLYSHRLEVDLLLVLAKSNCVHALVEAMNKAGCEIKGMYLSGLATARAVLDKEYLNGLTVVCDIGADITELLFFEDGRLSSLEIIEAGGDDLTEKLSEELKIPFELAEDVKRSHGIVGDDALIPEEKEALIKREDQYKAIRQRLICRIITQQANAICQKIKDRVTKRNPLEKIDNFLVCGRTILLEGFLEALEGVLGVGVKLGRINAASLLPKIKEEETLVGQKYLAYLTALGIICQAVDKDEIKGRSAINPIRKPLMRMVEKVKEVYQEYF